MMVSVIYPLTGAVHLIMHNDNCLELIQNKEAYISDFIVLTGKQWLLKTLEL